MIIIIIRSSRLEVFCRKGILRNFAKFTGKHLYQSVFVNKVVGCANLLKKRLLQWWFSINFAKFLRAPFLTEHLLWLSLYNKLQSTTNVTILAINDNLHNYRWSINTINWLLGKLFLINSPAHSKIYCLVTVKKQPPEVFWEKRCS